MVMISDGGSLYKRGCDRGQAGGWCEGVTILRCLNLRGCLRWVQKQFSAEKTLFKRTSNVSSMTLTSLDVSSTDDLISITLLSFPKKVENITSLLS